MASLLMLNMESSGDSILFLPTSMTANFSLYCLILKTAVMSFGGTRPLLAPNLKSCWSLEDFRLIFMKRDPGIIR